ncbi:MAG: histidine phosphatase family protein [Planctomycetes bacterium]|nr:histidine phosphatase family protein [Planctomycetota bacterium]
MAKWIYLVRHGEPEAGYTGRFLGRLDPDLSPTGRRQARRAARRLQPLAPARCWYSPLRRAAATAGIIADACGIAAEPDASLLEIDFGDLEGLSFEEVKARQPEIGDSWTALSRPFHFPGGEDHLGVLRRAAAVAERARAGADESVLLVAHGGILRAVLCHLLGIEVAGPIRFRPAYAALTTVDVSGVAVLTGFNVGP